MFLTSVLLRAGLAVAQPTEESLAPNAGFEKGKGDQPAGWSFYSWKGAEGWWDSEHAYGGGRSLGLRGLNGGWSAQVPVEAGKMGHVRFHYRAEGGPSRIVLYVRVPQTGRKWDVLVYKPVTALTPDNRARFVDGDYIEGADEKGWVLFDGGDFKIDAGVTSASILIKLTSKHADARAWLDDIVLTMSEPRRVPLRAKLLRSAGGAAIWTDSENRKIFPDQKPPSGPALRSIEIAAAQGEYESFQIAVTPDTPWRRVNWGWQDFSGPAALPGVRMRCRRVETVNIERTVGPHGHKGINPDPLTDQLPCDIPKGQTQSFWFTLYTPHGQKPGPYESRLTLSRDGQAVCEAPVKLRVRSFAIPKRPSLDTRSSFRWPLVLRREFDDAEVVFDAEVVLKRYYRTYFEHRSRCAPGVRVQVRLEGDRATVDASEYVRHLRFMHDELGLTRFHMPSLWISHRGTHTMPSDAKWQGRRIFANVDCSRLAPEFEKPFRSYMEQLVKRLKKEGLLLQPIVRFFDEPRLQDRPTLNALRVLSELMLDIEPEFTVSIATTRPHPELTNVIRLWILHTDAWYRELKHIRAARAAGCKIYVYNNRVNMPDHRPIRVRLWPWLLKKYGVDGSYSWWGTVCWRGDMADPWTAGKGSSGVLLYPPRSPEEHGPISSVRWEVFREGLEDYEYMHLAEGLADQLEKAGKKEAAKQGRAAIAAALELVEKWPNVRAANDEPYTLDVTAVAAAREQLAEAIEDMQR